MRGAIAKPSVQRGRSHGKGTYVIETCTVFEVKLLHSDVFNELGGEEAKLKKIKSGIEHLKSQHKAVFMAVRMVTAALLLNYVCSY